MRAFRHSGLVIGVVIAVGMATASPAAAAPKPDRKQVVTAGCMAPGEELFFVDVIPQGAVAFILDAAGEPTGEKLHLLSLDFAGFNTAGQLVFEEHKSYGGRTGQEDVIFCSGSFDAGDGVTVFFDVLATRR